MSTDSWLTARAEELDTALGRLVEPNSFSGNREGGNEVVARLVELFAMPGFRKRPYAMLLDRDGAVTKDLPSQTGAVTVLTLDRRVVRHVEYVTSPARLRALLAPMPATRVD